MEGNQAIWNNNTKKNSITFTSKGGVEGHCQPWCTCNHLYEGMHGVVCKDGIEARWEGSNMCRFNKTK